MPIWANGTENSVLKKRKQAIWDTQLNQKEIVPIWANGTENSVLKKKREMSYLGYAIESKDIVSPAPQCPSSPTPGSQTASLGAMWLVSDAMLVTRDSSRTRHPTGSSWKPGESQHGRQVTMCHLNKKDVLQGSVRQSLSHSSPETSATTCFPDQK